MAGVGAFWGARVMEIVKKHDSGGLVWKRIKLTSTRKANAKKRLLRVWQNEAVLKACAEQPPARPTDVPGDVAFQNDHGKEASHLRRLILASLIEQQPEISLTL